MGSKKKVKLNYTNELKNIIHAHNFYDVIIRFYFLHVNTKYFMSPSRHSTNYHYVNKVTPVYILQAMNF